MRVDPILQLHIAAGFAPLNNEAAVNAIPPPAALSDALKLLVPEGSKVVAPRNASQIVAKMFMTASVNIWLRAVHSFLISASLTDVSPIWASVSGYYSSHYAVRALAHALGYFQLFARKQIVRLELHGGHFVCTFDRKTAGDREHSVYWKIVKKNQHFAADPFFTENNSSLPECDVAHRDRANYVDHLPQFPVFHPLDAIAVRTRVGRISDIEITSPPIPRANRYPEVESVQIVAYHRVVRFRDLIDAVLGESNRFWSVYRNPAWARAFMDFQLTEEARSFSQFTL
jgi:hypothetical protein